MALPTFVYGQHFQSSGKREAEEKQRESKQERARQHESTTERHVIPRKRNRFSLQV
jgi:hypothetical protein